MDAEVLVVSDGDQVFARLDDAECRRLLGTAVLGRLGFTAGALPAIVPVPFTLQSGRLRIRPPQGDWVATAVRGAVVVLAVDSFDAVTGTGWGVTAVGPTRVVGPAGGATIVLDPRLVEGWRLTARDA